MYYFLVDSTMIENARFLNKSSLSKVNGRITKWTYYKERGFPRNYSVNY